MLIVVYLKFFLGGSIFWRPSNTEGRGSSENQLSTHYCWDAWPYPSFGSQQEA